MCVLQEVEDDDDDGGDLDDEDLNTMDEDLLAAAGDLLTALAASMGPDAYAPVFLSTHAEPLLARLKPQQPLGLRAIAAGAAAEVAEALGVHMGGVVAQALPLLLRELQADVSEGSQHMVWFQLVCQAGTTAAVNVNISILPALSYPFAASPVLLPLVPAGGTLDTVQSCLGSCGAHVSSNIMLQ